MAIVRRAFRTRRVGHAGTLDPFATGLLLVLVGAATRLAQYLTALPKRYTGVIRLGVRTDTDDPTGVVGMVSDEWRDIPDDRVAQAMAELTGARQQVPPPFSAKHVAGERAHRRARRGEIVHIPPVPVEIHRFALVDRQGSEVQFEADVSSGTYVRSLARELGERLGCGAHLVTLRRLTIGQHTVDDAVQLAAGPAALLAALRPSRDAVRHLPAVTVDASGWKRLRQGQPIPRSGGSNAGPVALIAEDSGDLLAVADVVRDELRPRVVFGT